MINKVRQGKSFLTLDIQNTFQLCGNSSYGREFPKSSFSVGRN